MFKFGDYTLEEVAQVWDCHEGSVQTLVDSWRGRHIRRQYWLFGPLLFEKHMIDEMAPDVRAMMKRIGGTRADREAREQEQLQATQAIEQHREAIATIEKRSLEEQERFFEQMRELQASLLDRYLQADEKDLPPNIQELIHTYPDAWQRMKDERKSHKNDPTI